MMKTYEVAMMCKVIVSNGLGIVKAFKSTLNTNQTNSEGECHLRQHFVFQDGHAPPVNVVSTTVNRQIILAWYIGNTRQPYLIELINWT